jgi:hypothetical protein
MTSRTEMVRCRTGHAEWSGRQVLRSQTVGEHAKLTRAAERLIAEHVDSVGTLDLLLLLHDSRDRAWSAEELCQALRCPEAWVEVQLVRLSELGLLAEAEDGRHTYRRGRRHGAAVDAIAHAYRRDRAAVTRRIFAQSPFAP